MFDHFYGRTRLTVFDKLYSMNMDSSARLQGQLASTGSPFAVLSTGGLSGLSDHDGNATIKTAPTLDVGFEEDNSVRNQSPCPRPLSPPPPAPCPLTRPLTRPLPTARRVCGCRSLPHPRVVVDVQRPPSSSSFFFFFLFSLYFLHILN